MKAAPTRRLSPRRPAWSRRRGLAPVCAAIALVGGFGGIGGSGALADASAASADPSADARGAAASSGSGAGAADAAVPEPAGYRMDDYDAAVPEGLCGARTVTAVETLALLEAGAVVVDVIPEHRAPPTLPEGQLWMPPPHEGVAGALWLPDTGFGALDPVTERYLFDHLARATAGDRTRAVVFYCRIDCWMSWNAAKRALGAGYTNVHWFRDGIEEWRFEGYPTATLRPAPGERLPPPE